MHGRDAHATKESMPLVLAAIGTPFIPGWTELRPFVAVLLAPFFTNRSNYVCAAVALAGVALAFVSQIAVGTGEGIIGEHFRGVLVADHFAIFWKLMLLLFVAGVILMW